MLPSTCPRNRLTRNQQSRVYKQQHSSPQTPWSHDTLEASSGLWVERPIARRHYVPPTKRTGWPVERLPPPASYRTVLSSSWRRCGVRGRWCCCCQSNTTPTRNQHSTANPELHSKGKFSPVETPKSTVAQSTRQPPTYFIGNRCGNRSHKYAVVRDKTAPRHMHIYPRSEMADSPINVSL